MAKNICPKCGADAYCIYLGEFGDEDIYMDKYAIRCSNEGCGYKDYHEDTTSVYNSVGDYLPSCPFCGDNSCQSPYSPEGKNWWALEKKYTNFENTTFHNSENYEDKKLTETICKIQECKSKIRKTDLTNKSEVTELKFQIAELEHGILYIRKYKNPSGHQERILNLIKLYDDIILDSSNNQSFLGEKQLWKAHEAQIQIKMEITEIWQNRESPFENDAQSHLLDFDYRNYERKQQLFKHYQFYIDFFWESDINSKIEKKELKRYLDAIEVFAEIKCSLGKKNEQVGFQKNTSAEMLTKIAEYLVPAKNYLYLIHNNNEDRYTALSSDAKEQLQKGKFELTALKEKKTNLQEPLILEILSDRLSQIESELMTSIK